MRKPMQLVNKLIGLTLFAGLGAAQTASISGTVADNNGAALIAILALNSGALIVSSTPTATSLSDGTFQITNVPAGTYQMCITIQSGPYVDPCLWNPGGTAISLTDGQSLNGQSIQVQQAALLHVRINDPQQLSLTSQANGTPRSILMGVSASNSLFYALLPISTDATGFDQQIAIPAGVSVPFTLVPIGLSMTDSSGNVIPTTGAAVTVLVPPANLATPIVLTYNVVSAL